MLPVKRKLFAQSKRKQHAIHAVIGAMIGIAIFVVLCDLFARFTVVQACVPTASQAEWPYYIRFDKNKLPELKNNQCIRSTRTGYFADYWLVLQDMSLKMQTLMLC